MNLQPIDIVIILLRARLGRLDKSLSRADKVRLMEVISIAGNHSVGPALYGGLQALLNHGKADGWAPLLPMLKILEDQNAARNRKVRRLCLHINDTLRNIGMEPVFLKGAAFILEDPEAASWRFVSDVDVLLGEAELAPATDALLGSGLVLAGLPAAYDADLHHHAAPLFDQQSGLSVELHRRLLRDASLDETLLDHSQRNRSVFRAGESEIAILNHTGRISHLIWHAQISNLGYALRSVNLRDMLDAAVLMRGSSLDLAPLHKRAARARLERQLSGFLAAQQQLLGPEHPSATGTKATSRWADKSIGHLHAPAGQSTTTLRLGLQYLKTAMRNPSRLISGLRGILRQGLRGHAGRILTIRIGKKK
jgi:hypothetical protein